MRNFKNLVVLAILFAGFIAVIAEDKAGPPKAEAAKAEKTETPETPEKAENMTMTPQEKKLLACTMLQIMKLEADRQELGLFNNLTKNESKERSKKVKAHMIMKCMKEINLDMVDKLIDVGGIDVLDPEMNKLVTLDYPKMDKPGFDWTLTADEQNILKEAKENINKGADTNEPEDVEDDKDTDDENEDEADMEEREGEEGEEDEGDLSSLDLINRREELGEENYRLAICFLFATKEISDEEFVSNLASNYSVTEAMHPKLVAIMLAKCTKEWPHTKTGEDEEKAMENYTDYIGLNLGQLKTSNFNWKLTKEEEELIEAGNSIIREIMDYKRNELLEKRASKKGIRGIIRWAKLHPGKAVAYGSVVAVAIFLVVAFYYNKKKALINDSV